VEICTNTVASFTELLVEDVLEKKESPLQPFPLFICFGFSTQAHKH